MEKASSQPQAAAKNSILEVSDVTIERAITKTVVLSSELQVKPLDTPSGERDLFLLQSECSYLFQWKRNNELIPKLRELQRLQINPWFRLENKLMLLECTMRMKTIDECRNILEEIFELVKTDFQRKGEDLLYLANEYTKRSWYFLSMITVLCSSKLHLSHPSSTTSLVDVRECFRRIRASAEGMPCFKTTTPLAIEFVVFYMEGIFQELIKLKEIDPKVRAENESICLNNMGLMSFMARKIKEAEEFYRKAKIKMETVFKKNAKKFSVYGAIVNNLGCIEARKGNIKEAKQYFTKAVEYWKNANDFPTEDLKDSWVRSGERNINSV